MCTVGGISQGLVLVQNSNFSFNQVCQFEVRSLSSSPSISSLALWLKHCWVSNSRCILPRVMPGWVEMSTIEEVSATLFFSLTSLVPHRFLLESGGIVKKILFYSIHVFMCSYPFSSLFPSLLLHLFWAHFHATPFLATYFLVCAKILLPDVRILRRMLSSLVYSVPLCPAPPRRRAFHCNLCHPEIHFASVHVPGGIC